MQEATIYSANQFIVSKEKLALAVKSIEEELGERYNLLTTVNPYGNADIAKVRYRLYEELLSEEGALKSAYRVDYFDQPTQEEAFEKFAFILNRKPEELKSLYSLRFEKDIQVSAIFERI